MDDIEIGTVRTTRAIGRDAYAAARAARDTGEITYLTVNGDRIAAVIPMPGKLPVITKACSCEWVCTGACSTGPHYPDD
jgi:hypothetical protein